MRRRLVILTALMLCGSLLLSVLAPGIVRAYHQTSSAAAGEGVQPGAIDLTDGVIMVGGETVDLQWTAANLIPVDSTLQNVKVWRNTGAGTPKILVTTSTATTTTFYRDTPLEIGKQYWYEGIANVCGYSGPIYRCWDYTIWTGGADTTRLSGTLTQSLNLRAGTYADGLIVRPGVTLQIGAGTTINGGTFRGGILNFEGVQFNNVTIRFGRAEDSTKGSGYVRGCIFAGSTAYISLANASRDVDISGNTWTATDSSISLLGGSSATIRNNTTIGSIGVRAASSAEIVDNSIASFVSIEGGSDALVEHNTLLGVNVRDQGSSADVKRNTIVSTEPTSPDGGDEGINAYGGTTVTAEDNTLTYAGYDPEVRGAMIMALGDARLTARRNRVIGYIGVYEQATATLTDNVITQGGLAVEATAANEIAGNTIQDAYQVSFGLGAPSGATITNNCFRRLGLWVYVAPGRATYLNLRGNYWGAASGPKISTNPLGTGVRLNGYYAYYDPWDRVGALCRDEPPVPPVASLELTANPEKLIPNGVSMTEITVRARDGAGAGIPGVGVPLVREPAIGNWWVANGCETGDDGTCKVYYIAPTPQEAAGGVPQVVISGSAGGQSDSTVITLDYLRVVERYPSHGTRNADPRALFLAATFDRAWGGSFYWTDTFWLNSAVHYDTGQLPCVYEGAGQNTIACKLQDLSSSATARKGLILTAHLKGGPDGVRGADGSFLAQDVTWQVYTTPELTPRIVPVQVADGADLIGSKPMAVRVLGGLSEDTELDWVEANVKLTYEDLGVSFTRAAHRFYPGLTGSNEAYLRGNSANFSSLTGEAPLAGPNMAGEHALSAWVEPVNQLNPPAGTPRRYNTEAAARVRLLGGNYVRLLVAMYPMVPTDHPLHEFPYPWQTGQEIASVRSSPAVTSGRYYAEKWTPLWGMDQTTGTRAMDVWAPLIPNPKNDGAWYLAKLVRHADWQSVPLVPSGVYVLMLVPWEWMNVVNAGTPTFHGSSQHVCVTALDAPAAFNPEATMAWCLAHVHGVADAKGPAGYTLRGYDLARDRLVEDDFPATGYRLPVMAFDRTFYQAGLANLWMDSASYATLMSQMAGGGAVAQETLPRPFAGDSSQPGPVSEPAQGDVVGSDGPDAGSLAGTLTVGGEIARSGGAEIGIVDILELPARGALPAPGGSGAYCLRLLDAGGAVLAEHPFTPEFGTLRAGLDYASFLFNVPAPEGVRSVELLLGTSSLATASASANPPQVTIQQPTAGSYSGQIPAHWTGSDADPGTALAYTVLFSPDNGGTWQAVALATAAQQLALDTTQYPNCTECRLKVIASDGFHSATAVSAAFAVTNPPRVDGVWPPSGSKDVPIWPQLRATFRDAMDGGTITTGSFSLTDNAGQPVAASVAYAAAARTATLLPAHALAYGKTYTARLAGTIRTTGGAALGADHVWQFTVEPLFSYTRLPLIRK